MFDEILDKAWSYAIAESTVEEIDRLNILQATLLAMQRAVQGLVEVPRHVLVDGNRCPELAVPVTAVIKGDQTVKAISAASILAKVTRDRQLVEYAKQYPQYGFEQHKGYGTQLHMAALRAHGPCSIHRRSFAPVRASMVSQENTVESLDRV